MTPLPCPIPPDVAEAAERLWREGKSVGAIRRELGISWRQAHRIVAPLRQAVALAGLEREAKRKAARQAALKKETPWKGAFHQPRRS